MFGCGNETAMSKGNGSGTPGLYTAWRHGFVEPVPAGERITSPQRWRITDAGRAAISAGEERKESR
jgi:hypothetical protein